MKIFKKTQFIDLLTTIKKNIASYLVISVLFGAAVAMFCGGNWTMSTEKLVINRALSDGNFAAIDYTLPYGTSDFDVNTLSSGSIIAEGYNNDYRYFYHENNLIHARIVSLMNNINIPLSIEGDLPTKDNEIAVRKSYADNNEISIGDKLTLKETSEINKFNSNEFTVTALIETPQFLTVREDLNGSDPNDSTPVYAVFFVCDEAFNKTYTNGYSNICLFDKELNDVDIESKEYQEKEILLDEQYSEKIQSIYSDSYDKLSKIYKFYYGKTEELADVGYITSYRSDSTASIIYVLIDDIFSNVRASLTLLFVVVSLFVGYSVISRMVHDHIKLIGTKNANGMTKWEVFKLYLNFSLSSLILGTLIVGTLFSFLYERIMMYAIGMIFVVPHDIWYFGVQEYLTIFALLAVFVVIVTFISVQRIVNMNVTNQLAGEVPVVGKHRFYEKLFIWRKLSLFSKTIVNNLFNDKRRVLGTVLGIIGSSALIIASFVFSNLVLDSYNAHFTDYYHFNYIVNVDTSENKESVTEIFDKYGIKYASAYFTNVYLENESGEMTIADFYVYEDYQSFSKLVTLDATVQDTSTGLFLTKAVQNSYSLSNGCEQKMITSQGYEIYPKVTGFFTNYLFECICYCDEETYIKYFGEKPEYISFFVQINDNSLNLIDELEHNAHITSIYDYKVLSENAFLIIRYVMTMMKMVFLAVAIAMSIMVLYNLITVYIIEKKRDLITLLINGYDIKYAKKYIYSDTFVLTILGLIFGTIVGELFGNFTSKSFASASCCFKTGFEIKGFICGIAIMIVLAIFISFMSLKKIDKLKLSDINL